MSVTLDNAVIELRAAELADPSAHLKPGGRDEVAQEIARWKSRGLSAHVLVVDLGDPFPALLGAFDTLGLDATTDLLLVFNTRDWVARGWGLAPPIIASALEAARPTPPTSYARMLVAALTRLGQLATVGAPNAGAPRATPDGGVPLVPVLGGIGIVTLGGLVTLAIMRRNKRAREGLATFRAAKASAERAYTDVILACEELTGTPAATELQLRAAELKRRMDTVVGEAEATPSTAGDRVVVGRIAQLENELVALRSTVFQQEKG